MVRGAGRAMIRLGECYDVWFGGTNDLVSRCSSATSVDFVFVRLEGRSVDAGCGHRGMCI